MDKGTSDGKEDSINDKVSFSAEWLRMTPAGADTL
jgi:hypothetical protein